MLVRIGQLGETALYGQLSGTALPGTALPGTALWMIWGSVDNDPRPNMNCVTLWHQHGSRTAASMFADKV